MTKKEIDNIINKKGGVAKTVYYTLISMNMDAMEEMDEDYLIENEIDEDIIAIFSFNLTRLLMIAILDNAEFFEKRCGVNERNRKRMIKDLETMNPIEYPEKYGFNDYDFFENYNVEQFLANTYE